MTKIVTITTLAILFIVHNPVMSQNLSEECLIAVVDYNQDLALYDFTEENPELIATISNFPDVFVFSPNYQYVAVAEYNADLPTGTQIAIYEFEFAGFQLSQVAIIPDMRLMRGNIWSNDSTRLLLQGAYNSRFLHVFDLITRDTEQLPTFPVLAVLQATWNPDNSRILFAARETPLPSTEYGKTGVIALYVADAETLAYSPVTSPSENVDWYFDQFLETQGGDYVFDTCDTESGLCQLNLITNDEVINFSGHYTILGELTHERILVSQRKESSDSLLQIHYLDVVKQELVPLIIVQSIDDDLPFPYMNWSIDGQWIGFVDRNSRLKLLNTDDGSITEIVLGISALYDWHPYKEVLLYRKQNQLIALNLSGEETTIVLPDDTEISRILWLCVAV